MNKPLFLMPDGHRSAAYEVWVSDGAQIETFLEPDFWVHVAKQLKPGYEIAIRALDMSWSARLQVRSADSKDVRVGLLWCAKFDAPAQAVGPAYELKMRGPRKWSVIRKSDNTILAEGMDTREQAEAWLAEMAA